MNEVVKKVVGAGVTLLVIGGASFAINQADVVNNFAEETGMTQEQAQQYVEDSQGDLESFAKVGQDTLDSGNQALAGANQIDCVNYEYEWESAMLSCDEGKAQLTIVGNNEVTLGNCLMTLDTDLGSAVKAKIQECITAIDATNSSYDLPIMAVTLTESELTEAKHANAYNKSVLRAALEAEEK